MTIDQKVTLGLIIGNRGFFPSHLCERGRADMIATLEEAGHEVIVLPDNESPSGSIESLEEARKCANLFNENRKKIDGVIVTLPNFGDERAISNALRWSELNVPVLIHAYPDDPQDMTLANRRDSFCGKMSCCNNLRQYGIKYTLTSLHTDRPESVTFRRDLHNFTATCRVVKKLKNLRVGALGARPAPFNTVRYSEKLLERSGISVETLDLYELFGWVDKMSDTDPAVKDKADEIKNYVNTEKVKEEYILRMAKFGAAVDRWMKGHELEATAIQCWTAMEEFFGVVPCTCMSMMSNQLLPAACEVDVVGTVAMTALAAAGGKPSAIVDWNNNYGDDPNKGVVFHCSNLPKDVFESAGKDQPEMYYQEIIAGAVGAENTYGTVYGRVQDAPFTYLRISTDELGGKMRAYCGQGELTKDPMETFGGFGVIEVPNFQNLLNFICTNGFEHHVSINLTQTASAVHEALSNYLGWETYLHS